MKSGDVKIDQVVIGSCTNGRLDDLRHCGGDLEGTEEWQRDSAVIVIPATQQIYLDAMAEGSIRTLYRGGSGGKHTDLRPMPGRIYGNPGSRGALRFHHKP